MTIKITPNTRVTIRDEDYRFKQWMSSGRLWLISEEDGNDVFLNESEFERLYGEYSVRIHGFKSHNVYDDGYAEPCDPLDRMAQARAYFLRAFDKEPTSRSTPALDHFIAERADAARAIGCTWIPSGVSMKRWLQQRGEPGRRPTCAMLTKTGRVPRVSQFPKLVEGVIERCVAWYWSERGRHKNETHARAHKMIKILNCFGRARHGDAWQELPTPNDETIRLRINNAEGYSTVRAKTSKREAKLQLKGTVPTLVANKPMEIITIDATVVDGWCVWRGDTLLPLGRPTLYVAVDVRSRMVINWFLTFEPPSIFGAMALLKRIISPDESGVWGKPHELVLDCGWENVSPSMQEACDSAGINLHWAPIRTPEYKAIVERALQTINKLVFKKLLGGSVQFPPHLMSRLGLNPSKTANITIEELDDLLHYALRTVYPSEIQDGVGEAPQVIWNRLFKRHIVDDLPALVSSFGVAETRTLTREGVTTKDGLRFYDGEVVTRLLDSLAHEAPARKRPKGSAKAPVKVVLNPEDTSYAMVWNHHTRRPEFLRNVHVKFAQECRSLWEFRQLKEFAKAEDQEFITEDQRLEQLWALRAKIEALAPDLRAKAMKRRRKLLERPVKKPLGDTVIHTTAPASVDGRSPAMDGIPTGFAAKTRQDSGLPPKGVRRGGKAAIEKANETRRKNREAKADAATMVAEAAREQAKAESDARGAQHPKISEAIGKLDLDAVRSLDWVTSKNCKKNGEDK